jgi:hypothetical protein
MSNTTTISLKKQTKDRLARIGAKDDSYDDIVNMAIDGFLENSHNKG